MEETGFELTASVNTSFRMRYADGTAFLDHWFIRLAFLQQWAALVPEGNREECFVTLESRMNRVAEMHGEWAVTIPATYVEARMPA